MKKLLILLTICLGTCTSIKAQGTTITIPENAITVYGTIISEDLYDGDFYYSVKILDGSLTNITELWINAGSEGEDLNAVNCVCESAGDLMGGEKFIAIVIKSERMSFNYETGDESAIPCYRPVFMKRL